MNEGSTRDADQIPANRGSGVETDMEGRGMYGDWGGGEESMWWMQGISRAYLGRDSQEVQIKIKTKIIHSVACQRSMNQAFLQSSARLGRGGGSIISRQKCWAIS